MELLDILGMIMSFRKICFLDSIVIYFVTLNFLVCPFVLSAHAGCILLHFLLFLSKKNRRALGAKCRASSLRRRAAAPSPQPSGSTGAGHGLHPVPGLRRLGRGPPRLHFLQILQKQLQKVYLCSCKKLLQKEKMLQKVWMLMALTST